MSSFKQYIDDYENSILTETFNLNEDILLEIPEVSFEEKENILSEEQEKIIMENSKLFLNLCDRFKKSLEDIQKCIRTYGFFENIDFVVTDEYIEALLTKIKNLLDTDEICDIIDNIGDDLVILENFCKNKNVQDLDNILEKVNNIIDSFESLENV